MVGAPDRVGRQEALVAAIYADPVPSRSLRNGVVFNEGMGGG